MSKKIDINSFSDKVQQSLVWTLQGFRESCIIPTQSNVEIFLSEKIKDLDPLLEGIDGDLSNIFDVQLEGVTEKIRNTAYYNEIFCAEFNYVRNLYSDKPTNASPLSDYHVMENEIGQLALQNTISNHKRRLGQLLHAHLQLFLLDKNILDNSAYEKRSIFIQKAQEILTVIETSINGILIDYEQQRGSIDRVDLFSSGSSVFKLLSYMKTIVSLEDLLSEHSSLNASIIAFSKYVYKQALSELLSYVDLIKIQTILLTVMESPAYTSHDKEIAANLLVVFRRILRDCRIVKLIFDSNLDRIPLNTYAHATTKLEIFFVLPNLDQYCLRIDFPHDNYQYIHYNLHEPKMDSDRSTGFPLSYENRNKLIALCGSESAYSELFYNFNNYCWFKNDFLRKVQNTCGSKSAELEQLFLAQSHYRLINDEDSSSGISPQRTLSFLQDLYEWIVEMNLYSYRQESTRRIEIGEIFNTNYANLFCMQMSEIVFSQLLSKPEATSEELEALRNSLIKTIETNSTVRGWFQDIQHLSIVDIINICMNHLDSH